MSTTHVLPLPAAAGRCLLVPNFLTQAECQELIALSEGRGYVTAETDYPPSYRNNHRHVSDSSDLAARLTERLRGHAPATLIADGREWSFDGINERFRFCRYQAGQRFNVHQDGVHHRGPGCRSHLTFLVYLTDGTAFSGGDTVFYAQGPADHGHGGEPCELGRVRPQAGSLLLFDHDIWHAGDEVTGGTKHVLRSDVLYRAPMVDNNAAERPEHEGYVWSLAALEGGWTASGGRDATIRIWSADGHAVRYLRGHEQSVLGLAALPGERLASVSRDRSLRVWNWSRNLCETNVVAHDTAVLDVIALRDGTLATGGADGNIKLWRQDGSGIGTLIGHQGWVWQLAAWGSDRIASASEDGSVRIWDVASMRCTDVLEGDTPLRTLLVADEAIWTGDIEGCVGRWTLGAAEWNTSWFQAHRAAVRRLRYLGDGLIASCGEDCALRVWDAANRAQVFEARHKNFVTDTLRRADAILSSSYDGQILTHDGSLPPPNARVTS